MSHRATSAAASTVRSAGQIRGVMTGLMLGMFLASLDQTIVATAIYTVANDLDGLSLQAWATTAYLITSTVSTPLYGKLSDIFGRRPLYLVAIAVFLGGSVFSGSVHSMAELAVARGIQGLGAGGLMALALAIIGDIVPLADRAKFQGYFMSVFGVSSVLGPVIGGAFAGADQILWITGWRWVFYVNVPVGIAALTAVFLFLHLPALHERQRIDYAGAAAVTAGLVPLLLVAEQGRAWGWTSAASLACYAVGAVGLAAFVLAERRAGDHALIPLRLFSSRQFTLSAVLNFLIGVGMFGAIAMLPMYLQLVQGLTPTQAGLLMITFTVGIMSASIVAGRTISATGRFKVFPVAGTLLLTAASVTMSLVLGTDTQLWVPAAVAVVFGMGLGCCMQPLVLAMQTSVPPKDMGVGTSTAAFFRSMGGAAGTAVFISMLFSVAADRITATLKSAAAQPDFVGALRDPATRADPANAPLLALFQGGSSGALGPDNLNDTSWLRHANGILAHPIKDGFSQGVDAVMLTAGVLVFVAFLVTLALPNVRLRDPQLAAQEAAAG